MGNDPRQKRVPKPSRSHRSHGELPVLGRRRRQRSKRILDHLRKRVRNSEQRTAEMEQTLSSIIHDLRTPLTVIQLRTELLTQSKATQFSPIDKQSLSYILAETNRMNAMVKELVDVVQFKSIQPTPLTLKALDLVSIVLNLKYRIMGTLETERLRIQQNKTLPAVLADQDRVERIFLNLLSNALKYSDPATEVKVQFIQREEAVVTSISDRGKGIPESELKELFYRYRRRQEDRSSLGGLGLGLFVTKELVEMQKGKIWVESEVGKGTTFHFTLPILSTITKQKQEDSS